MSAATCGGRLDFRASQEHNMNVTTRVRFCFKAAKTYKDNTALAARPGGSADALWS